jgi:hypothetical protein
MIRKTILVLRVTRKFPENAPLKIRGARGVMRKRESLLKRDNERETPDELEEGVHQVCEHTT